MQTHVEVRGLKELQQAFRKLDKELKKQLQKELRAIAEPAAAQARRYAAWYHVSDKTYKGIRPGSRVGMAVVRQTRRATTHDHPKFGGFQMAKMLEPAAVDTMPEAAARLEAMLDRIADDFHT